MPLHAVEVDVQYHKKTYYLNAEFQVQATPARVMQILTDFKDIAALNPIMLESELLTSTNEISRVRSVVKDCIVGFCRKITLVEDIQQMGNQRLESNIVPEYSDLHSGNTVWTLRENDAGTTIQYASDIRPKFWIPSLMRSTIAAEKFKKRVTQSMENLQNKVSNDD